MSSNQENVFQTKKCVQCGKQLTGRIDKKFCGDYCRNTFNNQNKRADEKYIQEVNRIIRKNRKILKSLCPIGKATVRKEVLDTMAYDYRYFSTIYKSGKQVYYVCYDYAFSPLYETDRKTQEKIEKALIVQRQEYFDKLTWPIWK